MVTIQEIAKLAGVSRGTVDRVFNGRGHVSNETSAAVWAAAQKLGYVPKHSAGTLNPAKTKLRLGYIIYRPENNPFFDEVLAALEEKVIQFRQLGIDVVIRFNDASDPEVQNHLMRQLVAEGAQGIILNGMDFEATAQTIDKLWDQGIPVVTVLTDISNCKRLAYIGCDGYQVGRVAGELMSMICPGQMDVGVLLGSSHILSQMERINGFKSYVADLSPRSNIASIEYNNTDDFESYYLVKDMLKKQPHVNTLLLATVWVYGACRAVKELPPEKRPSIFCFDGTATTRKLLKEGLITAIISRPFVFQAEKALDVLFNYVMSKRINTEDTSYKNVQIILKENV